MLKGLRSDSRVDVGICSVIDFDWESRGVVTLRSHTETLVSVGRC